VVATPDNMPGFWIFMYRVSPFTYMVSGMLSTAISGTNVVCDTIETLNMDPPSGQTCYEYLNPFVESFGGAIQNPNATAECAYCAMAKTDDFLASVMSYWGEAWRNFGLIWVFIAFNIVAAIGIYWLARVPKKSWRKEKTA
jgi:ABC-type multidrug transport system permease subunit